MTKGKALLGVLAGVAAGAALGVLFAPDKGKNTREKISKAGDDLSDMINDKIDKKFDQVMDVILSKTGKAKPTQDSEGSNKV